MIEQKWSLEEEDKRKKSRNNEKEFKDGSRESQEKIEKRTLTHLLLV